jgi:adenine-specific DNA-methyltransferase
MTNCFVQLESERAALQTRCDSAKTQAERNRLGQFATPPMLAREIMHVARGLLPIRAKVRFLDPAFGTGAFFSALLREFASARINAAMGFEIDRHYADATGRLWRGNRLDLRIGDFTKAAPPESDADRFNLIVCNPPYVRHHHLSAQEKSRLRKLTRELSGASLSGLAGLYCYFLLLADTWLSDGGVGVWLIPSEFMDVNYGGPLKEYLVSRVTLLKVHRFASEDVQFADALVSSSVICFRKSLPSTEHSVQFTIGGSLNEPNLLKMVPISQLRSDLKWNGRGREKPSDSNVRLFDLFDIKRGLATGDNKFFILTREQIRENHLPMDLFRPILPSPRYLPVDEIQADVTGNPILERQLFLLDCRLPEDEVRREYPDLWKYLATGKNDVAKGYLCASRSPWYAQENRPAPLFLCTYMGRTNGKNGAAFRFILNHSKATAANVYLLLYPKAAVTEALSKRSNLARKVWDWLKAMSPDVILSEGRVYGGGLHKVEPRELGNVPADGMASLLDLRVTKKPMQLEFFANRPHDSSVLLT